MIPQEHTSTWVGNTSYSPDQTFPLIVSAHCRGSNGRRWLAAWACTCVAHGVCLFLIWGLRLQVIASPPSVRTIALRLFPVHSLQASVSENVVPPPVAEELHSLTTTLHGRRKGQEKKKRALAEPKPLAIAKRTIPRGVAAARPKSATGPSSMPETSPLSEVPLSRTVESSLLLESAENPPATTVASITNREDAPPSAAIYREDGAPLPAAQASAPPMVISRVTPSYPEQARALGIQGHVRLEAILSTVGRVR